ncbi:MULTISPECIES: hypothetical protein [Bacillus cereus group]|uniref:hypothetical protein n=1 Tax=Bacillus cereus group TaxID=86661 RepID=UPI00159713AC|nr:MULTISPECIES: hypothetical protein [Bacillus cereus group]
MEQVLKETVENAEKMVTISRAEYLRLLEDSEFLSCLEAAGVDNWGGYGDAWEMMESEE